ncbi:ryanodine Receptor TM 4-6, partial [Ostertagia ostertagi]
MLSQETFSMGRIGKQMVDALVESQPSVEKILKFSDMFLKLKDLTTSQAFQNCSLLGLRHKSRWMDQSKGIPACHGKSEDVHSAQTLLEYFDPFLGRIEIMGSSKRVEKIYFEIQESWLEQWGKQQIRDSKNSFLFNVLQDDGGDQGKLEAFINFCEDTIFEMQHAAEISSGDTDSKMERAIKQRDYFLQQSTAGEQISQTFKSGYKYGVNAASALRPENVKQNFQEDQWSSTSNDMDAATLGNHSFAVPMRKDTWLWCISASDDTLPFRLFPYFTRSCRRSREAQQVSCAAVDCVKPLKRSFVIFRAPLYSNQPILPEFHHTHLGLDAFGLAADQLPTANANYSEIPHVITEDYTPPAEDTTTSNKTPPNIPTPPPSGPKAPSIYESIGAPIVMPPPSEVDLHDVSYEPKIAEQNMGRSRGSVLNVLARNFKTIEKTTLYLAFFINVILLFHRVEIKHMEPEKPESEEDDENANEIVFITGMVVPYVEYELTGFVLDQCASPDDVICAARLLLSTQ